MIKRWNEDTKNWVNLRTEIILTANVYGCVEVKEKSAIVRRGKSRKWRLGVNDLDDRQERTRDKSAWCDGERKREVSVDVSQALFIKQ